jgi:hypothetical protein
MRRSEVREVFQRVHDEPGFIDPGATLRTITNVGLQGRNPEAHLVIEEKIDLVWKQVPMVHGISEGAYELDHGLVSGCADGVSGLWSDM